MKYTSENIVEGIDDKLQRMVDADPIMAPACSAFRSYLLKCPKEIEQNLLEWINDEPLSDIDYYGFSLANTMKMNNLPDAFFMVLIRNVVRFKEDGLSHPSICYDML